MGVLMGTYLLKGIMIGLVFGVPAGVIGALTLRRTLTYGGAAGFITGLGCSTADLLYAVVSIGGLTLISNFMTRYQNVISLIGSVFIIAMGVGIYREQRNTVQETANAAQYASFFGSSFIIAITNPATILSFLLAFSIFNIQNLNQTWHCICLAGGIFLGTCLWWGAIVVVVYLLRRRINERILKVVNRVLGGLIILLGIAVAMRIILQL